MVLKKRKLLAWIFVFLSLYFAAHKLARETQSQQKNSPIEGDDGMRFVSESSNKRLEKEGLLGKINAKRGFQDVETPYDSIIPAMFYEKRANISPHNFRYILNPSYFCSMENEENSGPFLLILIGSAVSEYGRREIIRRTWGAGSSILGQQIKYLFFAGIDPKNEANIKLNQEFAKYGDVVQEDYLDTYRNLSLKTQGQLKWAALHCPNAKYVMHVDDDVVPDIFSIVEQHFDIAENTREITCAKVFKPRVRRGGKWETSLDEYPGDQYPLSCVGWCFVAPMSIVRELYHMSLNTRVLHLEDVWVTGILREKLGDTKVRKMKGGDLMCQHLGWPKDRPTNEKIVNAWNQLRKKTQK